MIDDSDFDWDGERQLTGLEKIIQFVGTLLIIAGYLIPAMAIILLAVSVLKWMWEHPL